MEDRPVEELFPNKNNEAGRRASEDINYTDTLTVQNPQTEEEGEHFLQFYRKNLELSRNGWMRKCTAGIEKQCQFLESLIRLLYQLSGCTGLTILKIVLGVLATIFLSFEYKEIKYMDKYLLFLMSWTVSFMLAIILQNNVRHGKPTRRLPESAIEMISAAFWVLNTTLLMIALSVILLKVIRKNLWTINYCFSFCCLTFMLLADPFVLYFLTILPIILFLFELLIFYLVVCLRNKCCKKLILGIDYAPKLHLRKYERCLKEGNIAHNTSCPICLDELRQGQNVIFMPCGREHVFHTHCIQIWLSSHSICPTCRAEFIYLEDPQDISAPSIMPTHHLGENSDDGSDAHLVFEREYNTQSVQRKLNCIYLWLILEICLSKLIFKQRKQRSKSLNDLEMITDKKWAISSNSNLLYKYIYTRSTVCIIFWYVIFNA